MIPPFLHCQRVQESIDTILLNTKIDFSKIKSAAENIQQAIQFVGEAMSQVTDGFGSKWDQLLEFFLVSWKSISVI